MYLGEPDRHNHRHGRLGSHTGPVHRTGVPDGPTDGAPYGITTVINAAVGPFSLGNDIVRTGIEVNSITGAGDGGGQRPHHLQGHSVALESAERCDQQARLPGQSHQLRCACHEHRVDLVIRRDPIAVHAVPGDELQRPWVQTEIPASSDGKTSRANGAALNVKVGYPTGVQANIKSVLVTVPKQLPSRLSTLKNACLEKVFNANPYSCPSTSRVGGATVVTPVLPGKLTGPAFFVSHGGAAFPDLDLVLSGDGVTVILVGNTNIQKGITTSNFAAIPDVPVTSFETNLPVGKNSAVTAVGNICKQSLVMPTTITAQNGKVIKQNTAISVSGCPVTILSQRVSGNKAILTVKAPAAGRVSGSGTSLNTVYKRPGKAQKVTLEVPLSGAGRNALAARSPLAVRVRVGFIPKAKGPSSVAFATVLFR